MLLRLRTLVITLLVIPPLAGCQFIDRQQAPKPLLMPVRPSADSVGLEIFFARFAASDKRINEALWKEVDEQRLSADVRRELAQKGFRVGVVGSHMPALLARLMHLTDEPVVQGETSPAELETEPVVTKRLLQVRAGRRGDIVTSGLYAELPLLTRDDDAVRGQTYRKADGHFALYATTQGDGQVRVELVPELHHGDPKQQWAGSQGVFHFEVARDRQVFEDLKIEALLAPGEMLIMTALPARPGSLGHYFFTEPAAEQLAQKMMIIRLAQTPPDSRFSDEQTATLEVVSGANE